MKPKLKKMQLACDEFNASSPVGGAVTVKLDFVDEPMKTVTISEARILSDHTPVIWLKGLSGCYALDCVTPISAHRVAIESAP